MRKCGTCRHFSDCGVAGSGNCLHVHRRHLLDVVLVRRTELACRNTYDQDLWEPLQHRLGADADASMMGALYRPLPEPEPPGIIAGSEEVRPAPGLGLPGRLQLRPVSDADDEQPPAPDLESQATGVISEHPGGAEVREARRRRQLILEHEKRQEFAARTGVRLPEPTRRSGRAAANWPTPPTVEMQPTLDAGGTNTPPSTAADPAPSWQVPPPEVSVEFSGQRPGARTMLPQPPVAPPTRVAMGDAAAQVASTPPVRVEREPRRAVERAQQPTDRKQSPHTAAPSAQPPVRPVASTVQQPRRRQVQPTEQFDVVPPPPAPRRAATPRRPTPAQPAPAPLPVPRTAAGGNRAVQPQHAPSAGAGAGVDGGAANSTSARLTNSARAHEHDAWDVAAYGTQLASTSGYLPVNDEPLALPPRRQAPSDLAPARPQDPIDGAARYADVPRCCATCVSYHRAAGDARGRCHNVHVFTVPHPVDAEGLACRSSIGSWWLPASGALVRQAGQGGEYGQVQSQARQGTRKQERGREV